MSEDISPVRLNRRAFAQGAGAATLTAVGLAGAASPRATASRANRTAPSDLEAFHSLRNKRLEIGILIFPRMDQIDFTGPFEVLSRLPDATVHVLARESGPILDHKGLILTPQKTLAEAPPLDILQVPGGPGQEALMDDEPVLSLIRQQMSAGKIVFSVCTGALICGAAGVLKGRKATTHWAAFDLLPYFGAIPIDERVVVDGNLVSAAGITSGLDGSLRLASLVRSDEVAEQIQLDIQYAPEPPFDSGTPGTAPRAVLDAVNAHYRPLTDARRRTAERVRARLGVKTS